MTMTTAVERKARKICSPGVRSFSSGSSSVYPCCPDVMMSARAAGREQAPRIRRHAEQRTSQRHMGVTHKK
jgi:hypothetical protein